LPELTLKVDNLATFAGVPLRAEFTPERAWETVPFPARIPEATRLVLRLIVFSMLLPPIAASVIIELFLVECPNPPDEVKHFRRIPMERVEVRLRRFNSLSQW
jgi:hypothetical protein